MKRTFVLFGIVVAVILAGVIIFIALQPVGRPPSYPVASAFPIYKTNMSIDSVNKSLEVFNENLDDVINATKRFLSEGFKTDNVTIRISPWPARCAEISNVMSQYISASKRKWSYDAYWVGEFDEEKYVLNVPLAPKNQTWKYENGEIQVLIQTCKNPSESGTIHEETGEFYCSSGIIQVWKKYGSITFIMDNDGVIYLSSVYCL